MHIDAEPVGVHVGVPALLHAVDELFECRRLGQQLDAKVDERGAVDAADGVAPRHAVAVRRTARQVLAFGGDQAVSRRAGGHGTPLAVVSADVVHPDSMARRCPRSDRATADLPSCP